MEELTPRQVVERLDQHIVGQNDAKRAVAIALRNRWRWKQLADDLRREVTPKNIIMIGPTGVGKTEITRRLADLTGAPFIKIEATKYTEVGYYGRDVESMIRDLVEAAAKLVRDRKQEDVQERAEERVEERLLDLLIPHEDLPGAEVEDSEARRERTRQKFRDMLRTGTLEDRRVELTVEQRTNPVQVFSNMGLEQMDVDFQNMFEKIIPRSSQQRELTVQEARKILFEQEVEALIDRDAVYEEAIELAEQTGIVFIDEIDKVCGPEEGGGKSADVSRQGVQRDLLPIVEGTTVQTRHGNVSTDKILFIAAGAFHRSRPSDLMPELQGRFPIRVELEDLTREEFLRILTEPTSSLTRQYEALLAVEGINVKFTDEGLKALADIAYDINQSTQNIGARRLHTVLERLLEQVSFEGPDLKDKQITVDAAYVHEQLGEVTNTDDLSKFIL